MHFHLPKPLHGWREFAGEVGIIVIGVLIALGAEQLVQAIQWKAKARATEEQLSRDLALQSDLASERIAMRHCLDDRLNLIRAALLSTGEQWTARLPEETDGVRFSGLQSPYYAPERIWNTQEWDSLVADGTVPHLNAERQRTYALLYYTVRLLRDDNEEEIKDSPKLEVLANQGIPMSPEAKIQLLQTVDQLRVYNGMIAGVSRQLLRRIQDLGELPSLPNTEQRLGSKWSPAMTCRSAREQLNDRVAKDWFTLHR